MQALPYEILFIIFGFVEKADLKSLRLVSRIFNVIAPVILFRSVSVSRHAEDLEVFRLISEHSVFRHFVQELIYFEVYFCTIEDHRPRHHPALQPDLDTHVSIIAAALARMPKLRGVILKNHGLPPRDDPNYTYSREDMENDTLALYGPRTSRHLKQARYSIPVKSGEYDDGFKIMRNALAISDLRLQSFCVDYVEHEIPDSGYLPYLDGLRLATFSNMSARDLEYTCNAFRHLRKISLSLDWYEYTTRWSGSTRHKIYSGAEHNDLVEILATANNLEELNLNFTVLGDHVRNWSRSSPLNHILRTCTWPRLQSLYLSYHHVDGKELADFVYRHRKTLKSLHFWQIYLQGGWWTWAESVQPWISSSLERIKFTPSWYEQRYRGDSRRPWIESEDCLKSYILTGHKRDCCRVSSCKRTQWTDEEITKREWRRWGRVAIYRHFRNKAGDWIKQIIKEDSEYSFVGPTLRFGELDIIDGSSLRSLEFPTRQAESALKSSYF